MIPGKNTAVFLTILLFSAFFTGVGGDERPIVIATTSVLGSIAQDLAGGRVDVYVVVSPSICPAHHDIKPGDVYIFSRASLILYHGIELWVDALYEVSGSRAELVKISGPWNTPEDIKRYYREVASALREKLGVDVSKELERALEEIDSTALELKLKAEKLNAANVKVVAMEWQRGFVEWLGFRVVAGFGPPEKLSSADIDRLVEVGRNEGAALVISNLQSGISFGESLAQEIGAVHVTLSNFPWNEPEVKTLMDLMKRNAEELFEAVKLHEIKVELLKLRQTLGFYQILAYCLIVVSAFLVGLWIYSVRRAGRCAPK